jgi:hypothetical protein
MKERREEEERMISMWKKANAFFFLRSFFSLLPSFFVSGFSQKKVVSR